MGQIILCETKEAENTYRFSSFHQEISTYEELCYYIREYFIFFVEEEIPESLVMWISSELGIRDLEQEWDRLSTQKEKLEHEGTGTTFKAIGKDNITQMLIPIPPLLEQERIVDKLYQLFLVCRKLNY